MNIVIGSKYILDGNEHGEVIVVGPAGASQKLQDPRDNSDEVFSPFLPSQEELVTVRDARTGAEQDVEPHRLAALPPAVENSVQGQNSDATRRASPDAVDPRTSAMHRQNPNSQTQRGLELDVDKCEDRRIEDGPPERRKNPSDPIDNRSLRKQRIKGSPIEIHELG